MLKVCQLLEIMCGCVNEKNALMYMDLQDPGPHTAAPDCEVLCKMAVVTGSGQIEETRGQGACG